MKKFLKNIMLGVVACLSVGCFSAHATKNNGMRQKAINKYNLIEQELKSQGYIRWGTLKYNKIYDYVYTQDIPRCLYNKLCSIHRDYEGRGVAVAKMLYPNICDSYDIVICSVDDYIIRGSDCLRVTIRDFDFPLSVNDFRRCIILEVNECLEKFMRSQDSSWSPEKFRLSGKDIGSVQHRESDIIEK